MQIGIDVEEKHRRIKSNILAFAQHYFSPYEVKVLTAISDPEVQRQEFIKLWTLKVSKILILNLSQGMMNNFNKCNAFTFFSSVLQFGSRFQEAYVKVLGKGFQLCLSRPLIFGLGLQL